MRRVTFIPGAAGFADFSAVNHNGTRFSVYVPAGPLLYVASNFTTVTDADGTYARSGIACLNMATARWTSFNGDFGGARNINGMATDGTYLYACGQGEYQSSGVYGLWRFVLGTGLFDPTFSFYGVGMVGYNDWTVMRFINGALYVSGYQIGYVNTYNIKIVNGVLDGGWNPQDAATNQMFFVTDYASVGGGLIACAGTIAQGGNNPPNITARHYALIDETTGLMTQMPVGFPGGFTGYQAGGGAFVVLGANVYGAGTQDSGLNVIDLPAGTVNASARQGQFSVVGNTGAWNTVYNPALDTDPAYFDAAIRTDGTNLYRLGAGDIFGGSGVFGIQKVTPTGAPVSAFGASSVLTFDAAAQPEAMTVAYNNIVVADGGQAAGKNISFYNPTTGAQL